MPIVLNMFREFSMEQVTGYHSLSNQEKNLFDDTYKKHLSSMEMEERLKYTEENIVKVEPEKSLLKVYFSTGECFIYTKEFEDGKWVKIS